MTPTRARAERGWLVTVEGPDGAGKTTQAARLRDAFEAADIPVVLLREPGGTQLGESIRTLLLDREPAAAPISPRADALLFNAARAQLVTERIQPALLAGTTVICSRFSDSTLAYQGAGMGLPLAELRALERFASGGVTPDLTILLDVSVDVGLPRKSGEETRFEQAFDVAFHQRVREGFLALAEAEPGRFVTLDAGAGRDEVFAAIRNVVEHRLGLRLRSDGGDAADAGPRAARTGGDDDAGADANEPNDAAVRITR